MKNLSLEDFKTYHFLNNLTYSPKGGRSAVVASIADDKNKYYKTLYVNKGEGYFPLTSKKGAIGVYAWLNEDEIIFSEARDKKVKDKVAKGSEITSFHKININGGEAQHAFDVKAVVTGIESLNDEEYLLVIHRDNNRPSLEGKTKAEEAEILEELEKQKDYQVVDELPYWFNGKGFINKKRLRICTFSEAKGLEPLTDPWEDVSSYRLSPCKNRVVYNMTKGEIRSYKSNLCSLDLKTKEIQQLLEEEMVIHGYDFWPSKEKCAPAVVMAASDAKLYGFNQNPYFYTIGTDKKLHLLKEYDYSIGSAANSDSRFSGGITDKVMGDKYYFTSLRGFYTEVYALDLNTGEISQATQSGGNICFFDVCGDKIIYEAMVDLKLQEIYDCNGALSNFNGDVLADKKLSKPVHHVVKDENGYEIDGWVLTPVDQESGKTYPAILNIHGGPKTAYGDLFVHEMQYWANCGYFVIFSNPRGGDGKGNDFADIRGKYGTVDYENLMLFTDEMCKVYPVDTTKLGVTGGSYGGYMTNWIVGHTDKFAAAATQRSICNWVSMAYVSDIGHFFVENEMGATAWTDVDKLWWHSPLKYADKVKTPTLVLHSDEDFRCWIPEAYQWFTALKIHGVETRMHFFRGENHELSRSGSPNHRARRILELTSWMNKYLKGEKPYYEE